MGILLVGFDLVFLCCSIVPSFPQFIHCWLVLGSFGWMAGWLFDRLVGWLFVVWLVG